MSDYHSPFFIFPAIYHYPDSEGVYARVCVKIFFEAACRRSECGPVNKFVVSWPLGTVIAEWHLNMLMLIGFAAQVHKYFFSVMCPKKKK